MFPPLVGLLYVPVAVWVATGFGLMVAFQRAAPSVVLRLAAAFLALWALLATTTLVWVLRNGGWSAVLALLRSPLLLFEPQFAGLWLAGAVGAFLVFLIAFCLNQLVGRGFLHLLRPDAMPWPAALPRPTTATSLLFFESDRLEAFSFTLLEPFDGHSLRPHRHEMILVSHGLRERLEGAELEAAVAHELSHIRGLDGRYLTFLRTLARMMRWDPLLAFLSWSLTRREEFRADYDAARMTRRPLALARALYKVSTSPDARAPRTVTAFLGARGARGRREAVERIRRLVLLADSPEFREDRGAT